MQFASNSCRIICIVGECHHFLLHAHVFHDAAGLRLTMMPSKKTSEEKGKHDTALEM